MGTKGIVLVYCENNEMHIQLQARYFVGWADKEMDNDIVDDTMEAAQRENALLGYGKQDALGNKESCRRSGVFQML